MPILCWAREGRGYAGSFDISFSPAARGANGRPFGHAAGLPAYATPRIRSLNLRTCPAGGAQVQVDNVLPLNLDPDKRRAAGFAELLRTGALAVTCRRVSRRTAHAWDCS